MNQGMNDTIVDRDLFGLAAKDLEAPDAPTGLLQSKHPGVGMIAPEEWTSIASELKLSPREFCVAVLIFEGNSRLQVARRLKCSPETCRVYIDRVFAKLNVRDRLDMVLRIVRIHLSLVACRREPAASH